MKQFTSATAPRQGGKPGRKVKLSGQALQILDRLMADWMKHGAATLRVLRLERPDLYARLALETATRLTLAESVVDGEPIIVSCAGVTQHTLRRRRLPSCRRARRHLHRSC